MGNFWEHTRRPEGLGGRIMLTLMNVGHRPVARWGMGYLPLRDGVRVLDLGCGGGANLFAMRKRFSGGQVVGLDYSAESVAKSARVNRRAIAKGLCQVVRGDVSVLPFPADTFHLVTAFETVYFWPDTDLAFREIRRVLRPGGRFLLCNEADGQRPSQERWCRLIGGMRIYTPAQLKQLLLAAGFCQVEEHRVAGKGWCCLTAAKG